MNSLLKLGSAGRSLSAASPKVKPKPSASKAKAAERLDKDLAKIRGKLDLSGTREERTMNLVGALAVALEIIKRANVPKNKKSRRELVRRVKASMEDQQRMPRKSSTVLLHMVKVCFPKTPLSDQSQYARFLAVCLKAGWMSTKVKAKFRHRREKSKAKAKEAKENGRKPKTVVGIKTMAARGKTLLKTPSFLRKKLSTLMEALM